MSDAWIIIIPGTPPLWRRARVQRTRRGVRHFTDATTDADEDRVSLFARAARLPRLDGPVEVTIDAVWSRPARCPDAVPTSWATGERVRRPSTPDADNVAKAILDGLTRSGIWADDCIADIGHVRRWYAARGEEPHTEVTVRRVGWSWSER